MITILTTTFVLFTGCSTSFRTPHEAARIQLDRIGSPIIQVSTARLDRSADGLVVSGVVRRNWKALDTTQSHLDVTLYDGTGEILRHSLIQFEPRQIRRFPIQAARSSYRVFLDPLPEGTVRIEVKAHEGTH